MRAKTSHRRPAAGFARILTALAVLSAAAAFAPAPAHAEVDGNALRVSLVTFGPGLHPFFKFGHNAILVEHQNGQGIIYNFGMFDFSSPALIPKFVLGRSQYWLGRTMRDPTIASYIEDDRTVELQELDLAPADRKRLFERLEDNARPQNSHYLYDYFSDNCSTRVRDALDAATGGRLKAASTVPARLSYRDHALRLVEDLAWEYVALYYTLGLPADRVATRWEESFIPMELRDVARTVRLPNAEGGGERPLVKAEKLVYRSTRPDPPLDPPPRRVYFALLGAGLGILLAGLGIAGQRLVAARVALGALSALLGLVVGLAGTLLVFLWAVTNHRATHANANILQSVPWALALVVIGVQVARGRVTATRRAFVLAAAAAGTSLFGLGARATGLLPQDNVPFVLLLLPIWLGLAIAFRALLRGATERKQP